MHLLLDEDVNVAVGGVFAATHEVRLSVDVLGSGVKDPVIRAYLQSQRAAPVILVTGDADFARRCRQEGSRLPCLWLHDLKDQELQRVRGLLDVIEREGAILGSRFFMEIRATSYVVQR